MVGPNFLTDTASHTKDGLGGAICLIASDMSLRRTIKMSHEALSALVGKEHEKGDRRPAAYQQARERKDQGRDRDQREPSVASV